MEGATGVFAREFPDVGVVQLGLASGRVVNVAFPDAIDPDAEDGHELLDRIETYFAGEVGPANGVMGTGTENGVMETGLESAPIALLLPTDQRAVLERLRSVPYGRLVDVDELARMTPGIDDDSDGREVVREAIRENPVPLFVPDHRVRDAEGTTPPQIAARCRRLERK